MPSRAPEAKSGAGLPPGTYSNPFLTSSVYEVQAPAPLMGIFAALFQVDPSSGAAVGGQERAGIIQARAPVLGARGRVDGEDLELGGADQSVVHHDQAGFKGSERAEVVGAQDFQVANILGIDLVERRVTLRCRR